MTEAPTIAGLTGLLNANRSAYEFEYNPVGQLIAEQAFDGSQTEYQYDATTGMLKQVSDASLITAVAFDNAGRVAARVVHHRESQTKQAETFAYDLNGQLIQATNQSSTLNWYYNLAGQLIREHQRYQRKRHLQPS